MGEPNPTELLSPLMLSGCSRPADLGLRIISYPYRGYLGITQGLAWITHGV
jgi:hypothetical protein